MFVRVWSTGYDPARLGEFAAFFRARLEPFFKEQPRCLGCFFTHDDAEWRTVTFWDDPAAVDKVKTSETYRVIVKDLVATGMLRGTQATRVFQVAGGGGIFRPLPMQT